MREGGTFSRLSNDYSAL